MTGVQTCALPISCVSGVCEPPSCTPLLIEGSAPYCLVLASGEVLDLCRFVDRIAWADETLGCTADDDCDCARLPAESYPFCRCTLGIAMPGVTGSGFLLFSRRDGAPDGVGMCTGISSIPASDAVCVA